MTTRLRPTVQTKLGPVTLSLNSATETWVGTESDAPFLVNGVEYTLSTHVARIDGAWQYLPPVYSNFYMRRRDWLKKSGDGHPSRTAFDKAKDTVLAAVAAFLDANPDLLVEAGAASLDAQIAKADEKIAELETAYAEARAARAQLVVRRSEIPVTTEAPA